MELVRPPNDLSAPRRNRHIVRWLVALIGTILIIESWRAVVVLCAVVLILLLITLLLAVVVLIRKATRPIGQLTVLDAMLASWLYRGWERRRIRRQSRRDW